jgi:hypothetical protein
MDRKIHEIRVREVNDVCSAVTIGTWAWFTGTTEGKAALVGLNGQDRITLSLPQEGEPPQLGIDGQSLLAVYPKTIFRLTDQKWTRVHAGDFWLPRSGPPAQAYGNAVFFRDEGPYESRKRLWWLTLGAQARLTCLDRDTGLVGPDAPRCDNSFSCCVANSGALWVCVGGGGSNPTSLLRRSQEGKYSIAILNNSVQFPEDLLGSPETDRGLSVTAVAALPDDTLLLVGNTGLYRLKGNELVQELAFTNTRQEISNESGKVVSHWRWYPSNVLVLDDRSYFISGAFGGIYLLNKTSDSQWSFLSLDEKLGDSVML